MLIRSQDRETLVNLDNSAVINIMDIEGAIKVVCSYSCEDYIIGRYSTKAIVSEMAKVLGGASAGIDDELAKSAGEALVKLMCFQMPADNEVEV